MNCEICQNEMVVTDIYFYNDDESGGETFQKTKWMCEKCHKSHTTTQIVEWTQEGYQGGN